MFSGHTNTNTSTARFHPVLTIGPAVSTFCPPTLPPINKSSKFNQSIIRHTESAKAGSGRRAAHTHQQDWHDPSHPPTQPLEPVEGGRFL